MLMIYIMEHHIIAFYIGFLMIFVSHVYVLHMPYLPLFTMKQHCYFNIIGSLLMVYYFIFKEKYFDTNF